MIGLYRKSIWSVLASSCLLTSSLSVASSDLDEVLSQDLHESDFEEIESPASPQTATKPHMVEQGTQTDDPQETSHKKTWRNPGGMWMPQQIAEQGMLLGELGLKIPVAKLSNPSSSTLQAIVSLGGCSGSFISHEGLIITNHHCAQHYLSYLSNEERNKKVLEPHDYVQEGFHAHSKAAERNCGPTERIFVTMALREVTEEITAGLTDLLLPAARGKAIEDRIKKIISAEEASAPNIRAEVKSYFKDETFVLIRKLEIKDVRMVFAPPAAVGYFGGDSDNWVWPRHVGDFSLLRAYVAADGSSREYHPDNVPYNPENILKVSSKEGWLKKDDLILVAGYPGSTSRLDTASAVNRDVKEDIPHFLEKYTSFRELLQQLADRDPVLHTKLEARMFSVDNMLKNRREGLESLKRINYAEEKISQELALIDWISKDHERMLRWGGVFAKMEAVYKHYNKNSLGQESELEIFMGELFNAALDLIEMAANRPKADADRHPNFQERNWKRWRENQASMQNRYDRRISKAIFVWKLKRALALPIEQWPESLNLLFDRQAALTDSTYIEKAVNKFYEKSSLESLEVRLKLFASASVEELAESEDAFIRAAAKIYPRYRELKDRSYEIRGAYLEVQPEYMKALRAYYASQGKVLAPDANSTLRITFGHVKGYERAKDKTWQSPFTNLMDLHTKHKWGDSEYEAPAGVLRALHQRHFSPYTDESFGNVPMNFLAAVDTTGGNSGSAALNTKGELVGLLFDGNQDALYSDWTFKDEEVRSILVDVRYVLWYLDKVAKAKTLLSEMLPARNEPIE